MTPIRTGITQGSPASPIIYLLYLTALFTLLEQTHETISSPSYIDNVYLMTEGTSAAENTRKLEDAVDSCFTWGEENAVAFDDTKSDIKHFATARKLDTSEESYVQLSNGTTIKPSGTQRWLRPSFERKLTWKHRI
jgi:hypothetical protein